MSGVLGALGAKLTDRWLGLLALPGVVFVTVAVWGVLASHGRAFQVDGPWRQLERFGTQDGILPVIAAVGLGAAAIATGYVARGAGAVVRTAWFGCWRGPAAPVGAFRTARRRARVERRAQERDVEVVPAYLPTQSTWMADRFQLAEARVAAQYSGLALTSIWPRLWLLVPDDIRVHVAASSTNLESASVLAGWGLLYLVLGTIWYPAALVGLVLVLAGWRQGRARSDALAELIESTVDVHLSLLLKAFGIDGPPDHVTSEIAARVNDRARKGT
ncbi:MAG TPA: hypothetical protein VE196_11960 [Pseudonocardiaceae bacterium]|jgi:hypothetical protein|nr:hypothetical protein [Pseudonocardiaceae bacterium]